MSETTPTNDTRTYEFPESAGVSELIEGKPTWSDLQEMATQATQIEKEMGLQVIWSGDRSNYRKMTGRKASNDTGKRASLHPPQIDVDTERAIFFHTHPETEESEIYGKRKYDPLQFLPSTIPGEYLQGQGDLMATKGALFDVWKQGGLLNILTEGGVTLAVGVKAITNQQKVLSEIRRKQGLEDKFAPPTWKVWTGPSKGESFVHAIEFIRAGEPLVGKDKFVLMSVTDYDTGVETFFLHLDWEVINSLEVNLHEVCFGNGVKAISDKLNLTDFGLERNLDRVNRSHPRPSRDLRMLQHSLKKLRAT